MDQWLQVVSRLHAGFMAMGSLINMLCDSQNWFAFAGAHDLPIFSVTMKPLRLFQMG